MSRPAYIFAGGGSGGHLYPALAVVERLLEMQGDAQIVFACSDREIDRRILSSTPYAFVAQPIRPPPRGLRGWGGFLRRWLTSGRLARELLADVRPAAVLGLGGFAAVPVVRAAAGAGVRTGLLCIDAVAGAANRHLARRAGAIFTQFERTAADLGRGGAKARLVGCPVRQALLRGDADEGRKLWSLGGDRRTLLVAAGSQGAANINQAVAEIVPDLDELAGGWQLLHVAGPGKADELRAALAGSKMRWALLEFCERMDLAYALADVVLSRAGASTVAELTATATPAVLMPYPYHRDQHQRHNAAALVSAGAAVEVIDARDRALNAQALRESLLPLLRDPAPLEAMRSAAEALVRPGAAEAIARWLTGLKQSSSTGR